MKKLFLSFTKNHSTLWKIIGVIVGIFFVNSIINHFNRVDINIKSGQTTFTAEDLYNATLSSYQKFPDGFYKGNSQKAKMYSSIFSNWLDLGSCATSKEDAMQKLKAYESKNDFSPLAWSSLKITEYPEFFELNYNRNHDNSNQNNFMFKCDVISVQKVPAYGGEYSNQVIGMIPSPITKERAKHVVEFFAFHQAQHETLKVLSQVESETEQSYTVTLYRTNFFGEKSEIQQCNTVHLLKSDFHVDKSTGTLTLDQSVEQVVKEKEINSSVKCE